MGLHAVHRRQVLASHRRHRNCCRCRCHSLRRLVRERVKRRVGVRVRIRGRGRGRARVGLGVGVVTVAAKVTLRAFGEHLVRVEVRFRASARVRAT